MVEWQHVLSFFANFDLVHGDSFVRTYAVPQCSEVSNLKQEEPNPQCLVAGFSGDDV